MDKTYSRWQIEGIKQALASRRVLVLAGARQCGKTTLVKELSYPNSIYRTLDDITLLEAALSDPYSFIQHNDQLMIIDEIQRAPLLLQAIKQDVDIHQKPGRFLLTGSANIQSLPGVTESLAGRVRKIRLRPLAQGEIHSNKPNFIQKALDESFEENSLSISYNKDSYLLEAMKGGYPEAIRFNEEKEIQQWYRDYLDALLERDLKDIAHIKRKNSMQKLVEILAAWSSKFMEMSSLCKTIGLARPTVESYINALEALYLVERVRPWHKTDYDRVGKQEKLFMTDSGLMSSILRWRFEKIRLLGEATGKLIETFVFSQLAAILDAQETPCELYHYRDREQHEIDFVIENDEGDILGIEVKSGSTVNKDMFQHLKWFQGRIVPDKKFIGMVLYAGENLVSFGNHLWAVPIHFLWA